LRTELPALLVAEGRAVRADDVRSILGLVPDDVDGAVRLGGWWVARGPFDEIGAAVTARLAAFHAEEPAAAGEDVATVRRSVADAFATSGAPRDLELADAAIDRLETEGALVREGAAVRLASHRAGAGDEIAALADVVRSAEPTPPTIAQLRASGVAADVLDAAVRSGALVRISPVLVLTRELVDRAGTIVREAGADGITVSVLRERLGTSRKYAVPLAEHLDKTGVTRRSGDLRFARGAVTGPGGSPAQPS
jgi:selenocysteine-specific elongation factor